MSLKMKSLAGVKIIRRLEEKNKQTKFYIHQMKMKYLLLARRKLNNKEE